MAHRSLSDYPVWHCQRWEDAPPRSSLQGCALMVKRLLPAVVLVLFLAGLRPIEAQPAAPRLSELAQAIVGYLPQQTGLPTGVRLSGPPEEQTNESIAAANPDNVDSIRSFGRVTGVSEPAMGSGGAQISISAILFLAPDGAW